MGQDRRLYECRADEDCDAKFLTPHARDGHESTHAEPPLEVRDD